MKINFKSLMINIAVPLGIGILSSLAVMNSTEKYEALIQPALAPPSWVFPVVWTLLYVLMGISSYLIWESNVFPKKKAFFWYMAQLAINAFWTILFFNLEMRLLAFIWLLLMLFAIAKMIYYFSKISKPAAILQTPYLLWVLFAGYLNLAFYLLNRG